MIPNTLLTLDLIKELLSKIPSVTVGPDMTGPVCEYNGHILAAVSRGISATQLNVVDLEKEFGGKTVALYTFTYMFGGRTAGEIYHEINPETFEIEPVIADVDVPATYVLRYAFVPD